jgi:3-hydroxyacyl-CoA dehydrogenase
MENNKAGHMNKKVAVIGAGIMGPDIAFTFAINGYRVELVDIKRDIIDAAISRIENNTELFVEKGLIDQNQAQQLPAMIHGTDNFEKAVEGVFFVTEAVTERLDVKTQVFNTLDRLCPNDVVLASNTSAISISQIASALRYPERMIGTHWIYPAHILPLVEIIKGEKTHEKTIGISLEVLTSLGKCPIICGDFPPFLNNSLRFAMVKTIFSLLDQGIAKPEDIDKVVKLGFGLRLSTFGPVEFMDAAGLDTHVRTREYISKLKNDPSLAPPDILKQKVEAGELGIKSGKGFYDYTSIDAKKLLKDRYSKLIDIVKMIKS